MDPFKRRWPWWQQLLMIPVVVLVFVLVPDLPGDNDSLSVMMKLCILVAVGIGIDTIYDRWMAGRDRAPGALRRRKKADRGDDL